MQKELKRKRPDKLLNTRNKKVSLFVPILTAKLKKESWKDGNNI